MFSNNKNMKVLKFGGTSVGSEEGIKSIIKIVADEQKKNNQIVVVVSAMSKMTNLLSDAAENAANKLGFENNIKQFEESHFSIVRKFLKVPNQTVVFTKLKLLINELENMLQSIYVLEELSPQTKDLILSFGERSSGILINAIFEQEFQQSKFINATDYIITDSQFGNAQVEIDPTYENIRSLKEVLAQNILVVTGFIAANEKGQITTLGRGGSDYTASLFGAALDADLIEIWTDVNGMMTADPRIVKKTFTLNNLSYTEAMELSYFGAKVIYPPTMAPVFAKKIPIVIRNTFQAELEGTRIQSESTDFSFPIKGISSIDQVSLLNVKGSGLVGKLGFSGRLFSLLARHQINIILITQSSSEHSISLALQKEDAEKAKQVIESEFELEIEAKLLDPIELEEGLSIIAIVGENMKKTPGIAGQLFYALGRNGINVRAIAQGSSEYNISVVINNPDLAKALNSVHDAFFVSLNKTINVFNVGTGNIGSTFLKQVLQQQDFLAENNDIEIKVIGLSNSRKMVFDQDGINLNEWENRLDEAEKEANLELFIAEMKRLNLPNCVFVDNTASAFVPSFYNQIFEANVSVVTCNKIANSSSYQEYENLKNTARKYGVDFLYETNVGAGLPVVRLLKDLQMSGDRILKIEAILSGTISYIFNQFKGDVTFAQVVKQAQELGFTEPDPRDDLGGVDFMRKMLILARDTGYKLEAEDAVIAPILPKVSLESPSVEAFYQSLEDENDYFEKLKHKAESQGKVIRYIGTLENGKISIALEIVDQSHPFYALSGSDNIISFTTERYKERPLVIKGPGAGAEVTAAGVFADLVNLSTIR